MTTTSKEQAKKFKEMASKLECEADEASFNKKLKSLSRAGAPEKSDTKSEDKS